MRTVLAVLGGVLLVAAGTVGTTAAKEFVIGSLIDRSGPTQTIGPFWGDGFYDYIDLFNQNNGLGEGHSIRVFEIDIAYNVPRTLEAYERFKREGAVSISSYGTPPTLAVKPKATEDRIPVTAPAFGLATDANGRTAPYIFPVAATYWSQMAAAIKFIGDQGGDPADLKIAYLYYDNPAGKEPLPVLESLQQRLGFTLQTFAVPPPGVEMRPQVLDIARRYRADWVITHLFGRSPGVSIKEFARVGFPRDRIVALVWGAAESDVAVAGWDSAEGYYGMQFAGVGQDFDVIEQIKQMYRERGEEPPKEMDVSVYYNRGVFIAALHARAIQLAVQQFGPDITGEQVKQGFESISDFNLGGFLPPLNITAADHEGGGWVRIYQARDGQWEPATDWFRGYRDLVQEQLAEAS